SERVGVAARHLPQQRIQLAPVPYFGHRSVAYPFSNGGRHDRADRGGRGMKNDVRCWYSLKPGRPRMYFSVSRAPVACTRKYVISTGESTVVKDHQAVRVIIHSPHHTDASPK